MKILLTGEPRVGKSTIIQKTKQRLKRKSYGIVAKELRDKSDQRQGFVAINSNGTEKIFSHKTKIKSKFKIKDYNIDVDAIDTFVVPELKKVLTDVKSILLLDEIGRMQAFSSAFLGTLDELFCSSADILGTIVYDPEPWAIKYKEHNEIILVRVTEENRDELPDLLTTVFQNTELINQLSDKQKEHINQKLRDYFSNKECTQIIKLFKNAIPYLLNNSIMPDKQNSIYEISGKHGKYKVTHNKAKNSYTCTCDLFNGKSKYSHNSGECSHIQTVQLHTL